MMRRIIRKELLHICREFGTRTYGSNEETRLAEYIRSRFEASGLATRVEEFPVTKRDFHRVSLESVRRGRPRPIPVLPWAISGFTGGEKVLEPIYLENISAGVLKRRNPAGKAALVYGGLGESLDDYRRLLETGVEALLLMSRNHPVPWPIADSLPWNWEEAGLLPTVSIPYFEAERILLEKPEAVRLAVSGRARAATSQNVIGLRKGRGRRNIVACAHHDTVAVGTGAIDNGTGVAILLALAGELGRLPPADADIALISFGAEEILSRGSFFFVGNNRRFIDDTALVVNIDGEGSALGESRVSWTGTGGMGAWLAGKLEDSGGYYQAQEKISPYSDQFPFNMAGIPSAWFMRHNFWSHYYQFHSRRDLPRAVDFEVTAETARLVREIIVETASGRMPFPRAVTAAQAKEIDRYAGLLGL